MGEEIKGQAEPGQAPDPNPQGGQPPAPLGGEPDYKVEAEKIKGELEQAKTDLLQKEKQINQAGFKIQKLKDKVRELGVDPDEKEELSEDSVRGVVQEEIKTLKDAIAGLEVKFSEALRTLASKGSAAPGAGSGQKPPEEGKMPNLTPEELALIKRRNFKWDGKKKGFITPTGRIVKYPFEETGRPESAA